jgi:hypothetical protein
MGLYQIIEKQISAIFRLTLQDEQGYVLLPTWLRPSMVGPIISIISLILFLIITLTVGLFLWNEGLVPAFPGVVGGMKTYSQFLTSLVAISMFL